MASFRQRIVQPELDAWKLASNISKILTNTSQRENTGDEHTNPEGSALKVEFIISEGFLGPPPQRKRNFKVTIEQITPDDGDDETPHHTMTCQMCGHMQTGGPRCPDFKESEISRQRSYEP